MRWIRKNTPYRRISSWCAAQQLAQGGLELAQVFGQAKREVQEAAVDRTNLQAKLGDGSEQRRLNSMFRTVLLQFDRASQHNAHNTKDASRDGPGHRQSTTFARSLSKSSRTSTGNAARWRFWRGCWPSPCVRIVTPDQIASLVCSLHHPAGLEIRSVNSRSWTSPLSPAQLRQFKPTHCAFASNSSESPSIRRIFR